MSLCHGALLPQNLPIDTIIELSHRAVSGLSLIVVLTNAPPSCTNAIMIVANTDNHLRFRLLNNVIHPIIIKSIQY
jgi:heme A synthase